MILLNGKQLADKILAELREEISIKQKQLSLAIIVVGLDPAIEQFIKQKQKIGTSLGIEVSIHRYEKVIIEENDKDFNLWLTDVIKKNEQGGIIIQLPLPQALNIQKTLDMVPEKNDVDLLSSGANENFVKGESKILPPVAGAVQALFEEYKINYRDKNIAILGEGRLVGKPVADWLNLEGIEFSVVGETTPNPKEILKEAGVIISGIGKPNYITGDMIKEGVIVIDAGTSTSDRDSRLRTGTFSEKGKLVGDVDFESVSLKSSFITPVPGGVGPLTIAMLFKNLLLLSK